jgi:hypothetical protein
MLEVLENIGAGEGNRTLVFSLEGFRRLKPINARSDKWPLLVRYEPKRLFGAVRMTARSQAITVATTTTIIIKREGPGAVISRSEAKKKAWHYHRGYRTYETRKHSARAQTRITS